MDNDKRTSNALLVVLATFVVTVAFLGVVIEYFDKDKEIVTTFWAPPWTVTLDADIEEAGLPDTASLAINNEGTKKLFARQPILVFTKDKVIAATAEVDTSMAKSFAVESEAEKSITLDLSGLSIRALDGSTLSASELADGNWTVQAVMYTMRDDSARPRLAWSDPVSLSPKKMKKSGMDREDGAESDGATE